MTMRRFLLPIIILLTLSGCMGGVSVWASDEAVEAAVYSSTKAPSITLVTVINNKNGSGGHSSLVINASQRVVFDPAGNFKHEAAPERNDLVYGMHPAMLNAYYRFHARTEWHVVKQEIQVSPEIAELAFQRAKEYGAVGSGFCANSVSSILPKIPGFETIDKTLFPKKLMANFAELQNVKTEKFYEYD